MCSVFLSLQRISAFVATSHSRGLEQDIQHSLETSSQSQKSIDEKAVRPYQAAICFVFPNQNRLPLALTIFVAPHLGHFFFH
jgi:hypothetical protein